MSRIFCLDGTSQVHPSLINFMTQGHLEILLVVNKASFKPRRTPLSTCYLLNHNSVHYCSTLSTVICTSIIYKCNLTVASNSHFSSAINTKNSATSTMHVSHTLNSYLGPELNLQLSQLLY